MEATVDALLKKGRSQMVRQKTRHRSGNKPKKIKKIKIQLPKIKLKTSRPKKRRPRPQKHRRPHRPPPRDSREVVQSEKPTSAPPGPPPPPTPRSPPSTPPPTPREKPTEYHLSEPKPTKLFKFELSEAKPTVYPLIANTAVSHGSPTSTTEFSEISEVPSPNLGGSPAFYFRDISDGNSDLSSEINGEIFPEELTNSINEFSEVAGSDGKLKSS